MKLKLNTVNCIRGQRIGSLKLQIDDSTFVFNVPDSFQRFLSENSIKNNEGLNIFFTRSNSDSFHGALGYMLTLTGQMKSDNLKIYAPASIINFFYQNRYLYGHRCSNYSFGAFDSLSGNYIISHRPDTYLSHQKLFFCQTY